MKLARDPRGIAFGASIALALLTVALGPGAGSGQGAGGFLWTQQFGTDGGEEVLAVAVDGSGMYLAGDTDGAFPGNTYAGGADAFLQRYDAEGHELWTRQFGTSADDFPFGIGVDASGVYVAGSTEGELPGQATAGYIDAFLRKYDALGTERWTHQFGTFGSDIARGIAVDSSGAYVVGVVGGARPNEPYAGEADAFVRKYDADGNEIWARQFGTDRSDDATGVAVSPSGVYITGDTVGTFPNQTYAGDSDAFLRKYDPSGTERWTLQFGTSSSDVPLGIAADPSGVYVALFTQAAFSGQTYAGGGDIVIQKYGPDGAAVWTRQFGTPVDDAPRSLAVGPSGVYAAGSTLGTLPGQTSSGDSDAFLRKYGPSGTEQWTLQFGTSAGEEAQAVAADASSVYVGGYTSGALPGQASSGGLDAFVVRLGEPPEAPSLPLGLIAGLGVLIAAIAVIVIAILVRRRRKREGAKPPAGSPPGRPL